jgi:hypothetical protein
MLQVYQAKEIHFGRVRSVNDLWGFCRSCYYADVCRGGCTWTSHSLLGEAGNNPYCHYRALELQKDGLRERIVKIREAAEASFAVGEFELITERASDGTVVTSSTSERQRAWKVSTACSPEEGHVPTQLDLCRSCDSYIARDESICPHCRADVRTAATAYDRDCRRRAAIIAEVERQLNAIRWPAAD